MLMSVMSGPTQPASVRDMHVGSIVTFVGEPTAWLSHATQMSKAVMDKG